MWFFKKKVEALKAEIPKPKNIRREFYKTDILKLELISYQVTFYNESMACLGTGYFTDSVFYNNAFTNYNLTDKPHYPGNATVNKSEFENFKNFRDAGATISFLDENEKTISLDTNIIKKVEIEFLDSFEEKVQLYSYKDVEYEDKV